MARSVMLSALATPSDFCLPKTSAMVIPDSSGARRAHATWVGGWWSVNTEVSSLSVVVTSATHSAAIPHAAEPLTQSEGVSGWKLEGVLQGFRTWFATPLESMELRATGLFNASSTDGSLVRLALRSARLGVRRLPSRTMPLPSPFEANVRHLSWRRLTGVSPPGEFVGLLFVPASPPRYPQHGLSRCRLERAARRLRVVHRAPRGGDFDDFAAWSAQAAWRRDRLWPWRSLPMLLQQRCGSRRPRALPALFRAPSRHLAGIAVPVSAAPSCYERRRCRASLPTLPFGLTPWPPSWFVNNMNL